ncbi:hypothetical protein P3T19_001587 [Paraburkholderia sp. GAS205]
MPMSALDVNAGLDGIVQLTPPSGAPANIKTPPKKRAVPVLRTGTALLFVAV